MSTTTQNNTTAQGASAPHSTSFNQMVSGASAMCAEAYNNIMQKAIKLYYTLAVLQQSQLYEAVYKASVCAGNAAYNEAYSQGSQSKANGWGEVGAGGLGVFCAGATAASSLSVKNELNEVKTNIQNAEGWKTEIDKVPALNGQQVEYQYGGRTPPVNAAPVTQDWQRGVETGEAFKKPYTRTPAEEASLNAYREARPGVLDKSVTGKLAELRKSEKALNAQLSSIEAKWQNVSQIGTNVARGAGSLQAGQIAQSNTAPAAQEKTLAQTTETLSQSAIKVNDGTSDTARQRFEGAADAEVRTAQANSKA